MIRKNFSFRCLITLLSLNIIIFISLIQPANAKYINEFDYNFTVIVADTSKPIYNHHFTYTGFNDSDNYDDYEEYFTVATRSDALILTNNYNLVDNN
jgi:hypothetical protein